jgi:hypothetical protein
MKKITPQELSVYLRNMKDQEAVHLKIIDKERPKMGPEYVTLIRDYTIEERFSGTAFCRFKFIERCLPKQIHEDLKLYSKVIWYINYDIYIQKVVIV